MSKDIKKALEHCINNECVDCPNNEELGSGNIVCRARLLSEVLEYVADLEAKLAESENQCRECKHLNKKIELNIKNKLMAENCELQKQHAEKEQESERLKEEICKYEITLMDKNSQLKNQLHGLPKKIVGEIKTEVEKEKSDNDLAWLGFKKLNRILDTILKKYGGEDE